MSITVKKLTVAVIAAVGLATLSTQSFAQGSGGGGGGGAGAGGAGGTGGSHASAPALIIFDPTHVQPYDPNYPRPNKLRRKSDHGCGSNGPATNKCDS